MSRSDDRWSLSAAFKVVLGNRCPHCHQGAIARGFYSFNQKCPSCGASFDKEPGYFLGATVAAYFLSAFTLVPTLAIGLFVLQMDLLPVLLIGGFQLMILHPVLFRLARLVWIFVENRMTHILDGDAVLKSGDYSRQDRNP